MWWKGVYPQNHRTVEFISKMLNKSINNIPIPLEEVKGPYLIRWDCLG